MYFPQFTETRGCCRNAGRIVSKYDIFRAARNFAAADLDSRSDCSRV